MSDLTTAHPTSGSFPVKPSKMGGRGEAPKKLGFRFWFGHLSAMNHLTFLIRALFCNMEIPRILQSFCKESQKTSGSVPVLPGWAGGGGPRFGQPQAQRDPGEASQVPQSPQPHPSPHLPGRMAKVLLQNSLLCLSKGTACPTSDPHSGSFRGGGVGSRGLRSQSQSAPWTFTPRPCSKECCVHSAAEPVGHGACHLVPDFITHSEHKPALSWSLFFSSHAVWNVGS